MTVTNGLRAVESTVAQGKNGYTELRLPYSACPGLPQR
jgi:hypothetical protein